jgi:hypothetical protein
MDSMDSMEPMSMEPEWTRTRWTRWARRFCDGLDELDELDELERFAFEAQDQTIRRTRTSHQWGGEDVENKVQLPSCPICAMLPPSICATNYSLCTTSTSSRQEPTGHTSAPSSYHSRTSQLVQLTSIALLRRWSPSNRPSERLKIAVQ